MVRRTKGFTLVELLVVIGIIAMLISILLPTLGRARKSANSIACSANLRSIVQGMQMYASQNRGYFPGGANTSAQFMLQAQTTQANCPTNSQIWDWQAPIARVMGLRFDEGGLPDERVRRFTTLIDHPAFRCPENDIIATAFVQNGSPNFPAARWISYCIPISFHLLPNGASFTGTLPGGQTPVQRVTSPSFYNTPQGYAPKLNKVGKPSLKIYVADGARFSTGAPPTMNLDYTASTGGTFGDVGAWSRFSRAYDRGKAPGNGGASGSDPRVLSYRHGQIFPGAKGDVFKFNAGFFDGHVETLGDLQGANPVFWMPKGTSYANNASEMYPDVFSKYAPGRPDPAIVQE